MASQRLTLALGDFSFHVVDLQEKLMEKQGGKRHLERGFEHRVLF